MESLTLSSYQPKKSVPCGRARGFESKWNHLTTEDALPELTAGDTSHVICSEKAHDLFRKST